MSDAPELLPAARRVPGWPRRWLVLFGLRDYLLGNAFVLLGFRLQSRAAFWQYVMRVEELRALREAVQKGDACALRPPKPATKRGAWIID